MFRGGCQDELRQGDIGLWHLASSHKYQQRNIIFRDNLLVVSLWLRNQPDRCAYSTPKRQ